MKKVNHLYINFSYDVREDIQAFGKHWYDDLNLGGLALFGGEEKIVLFVN